MRRDWFRLFLLLGALLGTAARAELDPAEFERLFQAYLENPNYKAESQASENVRFIFVTGLAGELDPLYFSVAAKELRQLTGTRGELDPSKQRVFIVKPSSHLGAEAGSDFLHDEIGKIIEGSPPGTKFRVVGHSLGGYRLWAYLNQHPERMNQIEMAVFMQAPFGGSPLAEFAASGRPVSDVLSFWQNPARHTAYQIILPIFGHFKAGVNMLVPETARRLVDELEARASVGERSDLLDRTLMLNSHKDPLFGWRAFIPGPTQFMNICGKALHALSPGPNDGLVRLADQAAPGTQNRRVTFEGLHHQSMVVGNAQARPLAQALFAMPSPR